MKILKSLLLIFAVLCFTSVLFSQSGKVKVSKLPPKFILGGAIGYNFVISNANGEVTNFSMNRVENTDKLIFNPSNYGMEQGGGITLFGKQSINRKRNLYMTGELGYNLFYNTIQNGIYRTKWNIFDLGAGLEFRNRSTSKNIVFAGLQIQYSLLFGGWQSNVTFPDNTISNIYVKIKPASRFGLSLSTGMEFKSNKKSFIVVGLKGTWANIFPKNSDPVPNGYETTINDGQSTIGSEATNNKDIIYVQLFTGLNFSIK
jgi:hypothetical protein